MPRFGQLLKKLIDSSGMSISRLAQVTGMDRPTIHKYIAGTRMPTEQKLVDLMTALKATANEQAELREQYELENAGELAYHRRRAVGQLITNLAWLDQPHPFDQLPQIYAEACPASATMQVVDGRASVYETILALASGAKGKLRLFAGFPADLLHLLVAAVLRTGHSSAQIQHLLCYPKQMLAQWDVQQCITALSDVLPLSFRYAGQYKAYYYYENAIFPPDPANVFPYCAILGDTAALISADCTHLAVVHDPQFVGLYQSRFEQLLAFSKPLFTQMGGEGDEPDMDLDRPADAGRHYKLQAQPQLLRYAPDDLIESVCSGKQDGHSVWCSDLLHRMHRMRMPKDDLVLFSESGIALLAREGVLAEWPAVIAPTDRIRILKRLREDCMIHYRRMVQGRWLCLPVNTRIEICENCAVSFTSVHERSPRAIVLREDGLVRALSDFAEHLTDTGGVASQAQTVAMIDRYMDEAERLQNS